MRLADFLEDWVPDREHQLAVVREIAVVALRGLVAVAKDLERLGHCACTPSPLRPYSSEPSLLLNYRKLFHPRTTPTNTGLVLRSGIGQDLQIVWATTSVRPNNFVLSTTR
jgi:hypothetical protein